MVPPAQPQVPGAAAELACGGAVGGAGGGLPTDASNTDVSDAEGDTPAAVGDENGTQGVERNEEVVEPVPIQLKVGGKAVHPAEHTHVAELHTPWRSCGRLCTLCVL